MSTPIRTQHYERCNLPELTPEQKARLDEIAAEMQAKLTKKLDQDLIDTIANTVEGEWYDGEPVIGMDLARPLTRTERRREKRARRVARGHGR